MRYNFSDNQVYKPLLILMQAHGSIWQYFVEWDNLQYAVA